MVATKLGAAVANWNEDVMIQSSVVKDTHLRNKSEKRQQVVGNDLLYFI